MLKGKAKYVYRLQKAWERMFLAGRVREADAMTERFYKWALKPGSPWRKASK